jgi:hypothetical protein
MCMLHGRPRSKGKRVSSRFVPYFLISSRFVPSRFVPFIFYHRNVHDLIIIDQPRTNNHVEGFHNRLKQHFGIHPHIYELNEALKEENEYNHARYTESFTLTVQRKKVYNNCDNKLKEYFKRYENGTLSGTELAIKCGKCVNTVKLPVSL